MKISKILILILLVFTTTVQANENYIEISQGEKYSEEYDYGGMGGGRGVGITVNQNFYISNLGVALSGADELGYEIQIYSSETGNIANELLVSKIFYADTSSVWQIVDIPYTFLAGNNYVINMRPQDGMGFNNQEGTLYIWTDNQPQDNDYGIFNVVRGFEGYEPQPSNPLHPIFRFYTEQNQTTPIEFSIVSSAAGFDAFGIDCDISLISDDNSYDLGSDDSIVAPNPAEFTEAFGGATIGEGSLFTFPSGSETWAGFANMNTSLYPISISEGGTLTFNASVLSGVSADVYFTFWKDPFPDIDPSFNTAYVTVTGSDTAAYSVDLPAQGSNTFSSFLLYVVDQDIGVVVTDVLLWTDTDSDGNDSVIVSSNDSCSTPGDLNNQQAVYVASSTIVGSQKVVTIGYASDEPNLTSMGFDMHFDSTVLSLSSVDDVFAGAIASGQVSDDGDTLSFGWASLFGQFPGANQVNLATVTFDIIGYEPPTQPEQIISINNTPKGVLGRTSVLEVAYDTTDNNNQLSGLGMRVHFDSSLLSFKEITSLIEQDIIVSGEGPFSDDADFDNDPLTDQYMLFGWASLYNNWPNTELPAVLMNIAFDVSENINTDVISSTNINFTDTSFTVGYEFSAESYELEILNATWDFDGNGQADALTDGLMMLRYLFGLRGDLVTNDAMAINSSFDSQQVVAEIEAAMDIADIDADGEPNALTDGLLLLRYLFGLRDDFLTNGVIGPDATRSSNTNIHSYLDLHMPNQSGLFDRMLTVSVEEASSVGLTGPWWGWDSNGGPEATDNGDGTWTVVFNSAPTENMEYLWVVDGVQEVLYDNAANAECGAEIDGGSLITDYWSYGNRVWVLGSGDASDTYDACGGSSHNEVNVTFQVNMAGVDTANGVSVMGGYIFGQAGVDMSDDDGDNIWTVTTQLVKNTNVMFKYRNTTAYTWDNMEFIMGDCVFGEWNDRQVMVAETDITLPVVSFGSCTAQPIVVDTIDLVFDFEDNTVQYPSYGGLVASFATQDDAGDTRNMLKLVNGADSAWWSGVTLAVLPAGNDFRGDGTATMRVYAEQAGNLNLELEADGQGPAVVNLAVAQGWNDLSFDFSGASDSVSWHKIQIRPDALGEANNAAETTYYIDDVSFPNSAILDTDDDGANDLVDDLPNDATETVDSDGDGVGDNADELPNDPAFSTQAEYDAAQAIPASPVPTEAADSVLSIFSNAYTDLVGTDFNPGWGQATQIVVADDVITYTGLNYQGTAFTNSDVSGYGYINVDFYTADSTVLKFTIISSGQEKLITLADPIVLNQWNSVKIPLTEFDNVNLADVFQFKFDGNGNVVLDNLYFGGVGQVVEPPAKVNVTFQVNMAGVDTTNGVSVMGGTIFGQAGLDMSDDDGDNIWTVTTALDVNSTVSFKYRNTTALTWDGQEPVSGDCTVGEWNERLVEVGEADITLPVDSFGSCTALPIVVDTIDLVFDFEDSSVDYPSYGGVSVSYATQDDAGVTRNMLKLVNGANSAWWSGVTLAALPAGNDFLGNGMTPITMRVYAEQNGDIRLDLEADGQTAVVVNLAVAQGWNDLSFDFSGADAAINWHKIQIRPDAAGGANNAAETIYYIDDVTFPNASILDSDSDGVNDLVDDLPNDATETVDSDGDGVGDNADELPNDPAYSTQAAYDADYGDDDNDGRINKDDYAPNDPNVQDAPTIPASPVPADAADSVLSIFSNAYTNLEGTDFNPNWGQSTSVEVGDNLIYSNLNYQGTQFANQDVSDYEYLNVDYYVDYSLFESSEINFYLISPGAEKPFALDLSSAEQWNSVQIPLSHYDNVNLADVFQFKVDGNGSVAFNNIYFGGG